MATPDENGAQDLMSAYLDQQLDEEQAAAFEEYLAEDPSAQEELAELRQMLQLVSALPTLDAPPDFYDKVARKLRRRQMLSGDALMLSLISLPFQVLSILVILVVAAVFMMAQLDQDPGGKLELDPAPQTAPGENETPPPVVP